ncbi:unnamed protein product [Ectocarpus sp. 6 AP-2014]
MGQQQSTDNAKRRRRSTALAAGFVTGSSGKVEEKYSIDLKPLGRGHYGVVRRCISIETGQQFAMKTIRKARVSRVESLLREVQILRKVSHPNIIELVDVYEDEMNLHLVTELCTGGELFDSILEKTESEEGRYSERDAMTLVTKILSAIAYCHDEHNICHRDLKPENFLFKDKADDSELKIIDFGLSRFEETNQIMTTRVGTPYCVQTMPSKCSLGPYSSHKTQHGAPFFFLQALKLPWLHVLDDEAAESAAVEGEPGDATTTTATAAAAAAAARMDKPLQLSSRLRRFTGMSNLKRAALNVIANQLTEADIGHLRNAFREIDADNNGSICVDELKMVVKKEGLEYIEEEVMTMLRGVDLDGNDSIEWKEFLAATIDRNVFIREDNVRRAFQHFDIEGSGSITLANLVSIFGSEDHAREIVAGDIDLDGDGEISFDEFRQMMEEDQTTTTATATSKKPVDSAAAAAGPTTAALTGA